MKQITRGEASLFVTTSQEIGKKKKFKIKIREI